MTLWKTKKKWEVPIWESQLKRAKEQLAKANAVVIGAGSGLSAAAGPAPATRTAHPASDIRLEASY